MEAEKEEKIKLRVLVDTKQNQVVFAESDKDFIDILFSFLSLPMGTIVRLLRDQSQSSITIGSMTTLFQGLENLDPQNFLSHEHKAILLRPSNAAEPQCRKLKLNIDDTEPTKYYICRCLLNGEEHAGGELLSYFPGPRCSYNRVMDNEVYLVDDNVGSRSDPSVGVFVNGNALLMTNDSFASREDEKGGVFVKSKARFIITDDLRVLPLSSFTSFEFLKMLDVKDAKVLEQRIVDIGLSEVISLLGLSFLSKTPLTDLILLKPMEFSSASEFDQLQVKSQTTMNRVSDGKLMTLKVMLRKSNNKFLYAEAQEDFIDYLLSLLGIPLGTIVNLLDLTPSLGCICNLYRSVEELSVDKDLKSEHLKSKLLAPKLGPQFGYKIHPLGIKENFYPQNMCTFQQSDPSSKEFVDIYIKGSSPTSEPIGTQGFVEGLATFIVTDDLVVTPFSPISNILLLNKLQVPINDLEVKVINIGYQEARRLLEASLTSKSALTTAFHLNRLTPTLPKIDE